MLVVQPTSTCDVCLERYAWDAPASDHLSKPHVISCGHVFCHQCLQNLRIPRTCPLCRAAFHLTRAVRVHVDLVSQDAAVRMISEDEWEARRFELRLAELFASASASTSASGTATAVDSDPPDGADADADAAVDASRAVAVEEALSWLENAPAESHPVLRSTLASIARQTALAENLRSTQAEAARVRGERDHVRRHLRRAERAREQEQLLAQNQEKTWAVRVSEIERDCEKKLTEANAERQRLEDELVRCRATLKDAHAAQADVLVQAQLQIHTQSQEPSISRARSPPTGPTQSIPQPIPISQDPPSSISSVARPAPAGDARPQPQQAGPASTSTTSAIAFPRTSSPAPSAYDSASAYEFSYNPLPRPPEPVPLSRLPAFARPRPGSSAYTAARALARHGHGHGKLKEERDRDRERSERKKEKEKERERERERERRREREGTGTDSGTGKERRRSRSGKERDRGTDTSATETQDRRRTRTRHASLVGPSSSHPELASSTPANGTDFNTTRQANGQANGPVNSLPALPRDVVGGWGLERSWRASLASSTSGASAPVSREDLRGDFREADGGTVGSSHTKMRVSKEKGKGKEKDGDVREIEGTEEVREDYVFVRSAAQEKREHERRRERDRERHVSFTSYPFESREATQELLQNHSQMQGRERERRTTLGAAPSALGLVLVPSPDGRGGYAYEYQYRPVPPQSTIQTGSASGKESVTPVASTNGGGVHSNQNAGNFIAAREMQSRASTASNAMLTRRATDGHLQAHAHAIPAVYPIPRQPRAPSTTALHVPQPRRISLNIPEPEADPSPQPEPVQAQTTHQSFRTEDKYANHAYPAGDTYRDTYGQRTVGTGGLYANTNPSANMSLDSALASISLAEAGAGNGQQTLRHRTSNSSTASASTGISLSGTSGERRKQLLDALFTDTEGSSNRSSYASDANRVSIGQALDAAGDVNGGAGEVNGGAIGSRGGAAAAATPANANAARGVPSRDGRPSRGLSTSTRPSTTHPLQTISSVHAAQPLPASGTTYAPLQQQHAPSHVRQATYPPPTYASNAASAAYATQSQAQIPYASNISTGAAYQTQAPTTAAPSAAAYAAYAAYYQSQSQVQAPSQPSSSALVLPAGQFVGYRVQEAGAAGSNDRR